MTTDAPTPSTTLRRDFIKARLANVREWLDSVLGHITPELVDWAPAEGMRTVGGQLAELLSIEIPLVPRLKEGRCPTDEEVNALIGNEGDLEGLKQRLVETRQRTLDYLDTLSDAELSEVVPSGPQYYGTLWLPEMARAEFFLNVSEHEFYHVGQLISYLWATGNDPYAW